MPIKGGLQNAENHSLQIKKTWKTNNIRNKQSNTVQHVKRLISCKTQGIQSTQTFQQLVNPIECKKNKCSQELPQKLGKNQLILIFILYKQQKLSTFISPQTTPQELLKEMYKQLYIYQKQTYSLSNGLLKNLLYKIKGFESIDHNLLCDFRLKYRKGTITMQMFFSPFDQLNPNMPFKIYAAIPQSSSFTNHQQSSLSNHQSSSLSNHQSSSLVNQNSSYINKSYQSNQFLIRNYSDGQFGLLTSIKKNTLSEEELLNLRKTLRFNFNAALLLTKNLCTSICKFNWFQTKNHIFATIQYYSQTLPEYLQRFANNNQVNKLNTIKYLVKQFSHFLKMANFFNVQAFKKLKLQNFVLNALDGSLKLNPFSNLYNCGKLADKRNSRISSSGNSDKFADKNCVQSFKQIIIDLIRQITKLSSQNSHSQNSSYNFLLKILEICDKQNFSFDHISKTEEIINLDEKVRPYGVNFQQKFSKIISNQRPHNNTYIEQTKCEITNFFRLENTRKLEFTEQIFQNKQNVLKQQNIENLGNISQYKKQQQRKSQLNTRQKMHIKQIMKGLNLTYNFIIQTKKNNLASIESYLKKSNSQTKRRMMNPIRNKYKRFLEQNKQNKQINSNNNSNNNINKNTIQQIQLEFNQISKSLKCSLRNPRKLQHLFVKTNRDSKGQKIMRNSQYKVYLPVPNIKLNKIKTHFFKLNERSI